MKYKKNIFFLSFLWCNLFLIFIFFMVYYFFTVFFFNFTLFYFTILYWFCHTSTWICHGCTCVPNPEHLSHFPPQTISLGHPSTPAPSILYPAPRLAIHFLYDIIHVSMPFSQIIPPSPSPTQYKRLFYIRINYVDTDHVS